jgi:hypothetical protein
MRQGEVIDRELYVEHMARLYEKLKPFLWVYRGRVGKIDPAARKRMGVHFTFEDGAFVLYGRWAVMPKSGWERVRSLEEFINMQERGDFPLRRKQDVTNDRHNGQDR